MKPPAFPILAIGASLTLFVGSASNARAMLLIDFDDFTPASPFAGGVEDNFLIGDISGPVAVSPSHLGPYSGTNSIHHDSASNATFSLAATSGSPFELLSFFAGSAYGGGETLTIHGYLNGSLVGSDSFSPNPAGSYVQYVPVNLAGMSVDSLVFDMGPAGPGPTHIDDIALSFTAIPEPASVLGIACLITGGTFLRQRRAKK